MSKNNYYVGATQTLATEDRSLDSIVFQPTKPVLDSELNTQTLPLCQQAMGMASPSTQSPKREKK
jgi:hypothetical protein